MISAATITLPPVFCRYESGFEAIAGTVTVTGDVGDTFSVCIIRTAYEIGELTVTEEPRTLQTGQSGVAQNVRILLSSILAPCSKMRGDYRLEVVASGVVKASSAFTVVPLTADEVRNRWARGLPLSAPDSSYVTSDDDIIDIALHAYHQAAHELRGYPEPIRIASPLLVEKGIVTAADQIKGAADYTPPPTRNTWLTVRTPTPSLLTVHKLEGWLNQEKTVSLERNWISITEKAGLISLVPSNAAILSWTFYGPAFHMFFASHNHLPNFWQYEVTAGLRSIPPILGEYIARSAAIELLTQVGQALNPRGGVNYSLSRDGVTESRGLNPQGVYAAIIGQYERMNGVDKEGKNQGMRDLRKRLFGIPLGIL